MLLHFETKDADSMKAEILVCQRWYAFRADPDRAIHDSPGQGSNPGVVFQRLVQCLLSEEIPRCVRKYRPQQDLCDTRDQDPDPQGWEQERR